jgi:hypothetical protein
LQGPALAMAKRDAAFGEVIRRQFHRDFIAGENADAVASQPSGQMGEYDAIMFELDAEQSTGELLQYSSGYFNAVFFTQRCSLLLLSDGPPTGLATEQAG